jgi:glycine/D-amino acid oxidase-like deaminating enzyme
MNLRSPWLQQLNQERQIVRLASDLDVQVVIVGAGIAGVASAFFTLKYTNKKVILLEGGKLAHGATGHNAGYLASYFERPFNEIVREFGLEKAIAGQRAIDSGWQFLDEIYTDAGLDIQIARFQGYAGFVKFSRVLSHLKNSFYRKLGGMETDEFLISESVDFLSLIPKEYVGLYKVVPMEDILERLETVDSRFIACAPAPKGCMNSALFCQEVLNFLIKNYSDRFSLFEHTHVNKIILKFDHALLDAGSNTVIAEKVILCTNGFENIRLINESGLDINTKFHHHIYGFVGFMSGYLDPLNKPPTAISYLEGDKGDETDIENYFYLSRRLYDYEEKKNHNLISVGGPGFVLDERSVYAGDMDFPEEAHSQIDQFIRRIYESNPYKKIDYLFTWHGLMGYTKSGIRLIGEEPKNRILLYNLGCNGVGIIPSLYGGKKISQILAGEELEESIFDPRLE